MPPINTIEIYNQGVLIHQAKVGVLGCKLIKVANDGKILIATESSVTEYGFMQYIATWGKEPEKGSEKLPF